MLSLAEYESLQETAYLLRSPANAKRLLAAVDTLKRGKGLKRKIKLGVSISFSHRKPGTIIFTGKRPIRRRFRESTF